MRNLKKKEYNVFVATKDDIQGIQNLLYPSYFEESTYSGLDYDEENTRKVIENWIANFCFIGKDKNGKVIGVVSFYAMRTFYKQLEIDVELFYVLPEWRGTGLSRHLVENLTNQADKHGVPIIYTGCASGIDEKNNKLYENLFKKYEFKPLGTELIRIKK